MTPIYALLMGFPTRRNFGNRVGFGPDRFTIMSEDTFCSCTFWAISRLEGFPSLASDSSNTISEFDSSTTCAKFQVCKEIRLSIESARKGYLVLTIFSPYPRTNNVFLPVTSLLPCFKFFSQVARDNLSQSALWRVLSHLLGENVIGVPYGILERQPSALRQTHHSRFT